MKIVVFDLDETLGNFTQLGIFWDCLKEFLHVNGNSEKLTQHDFNQTLDLFPEFLRPNILPILQYLKHKKNTKCCHKLMIYTVIQELGFELTRHPKPGTLTHPNTDS